MRPCIDTLLNQTLRDIEIICVLDCPTDGSDKVIEEYAAKDDRIVVVRNEHNLNIGESRNVGLQIARGIYIGFSDHDDIHELDMYEKLYQATEHETSKMVLSGRIVVENGLSTADGFRQNCLSYMMKSTAHITPHIFQREVLVSNNLSFIDTKKTFGEDIIFFLQVVNAIESDSCISIVKDTLYHHIETGHNTAGMVSYFSLQKLDLFAELCKKSLEDGGFRQTIISDLPVLLVLKSYTLFRRLVANQGFQFAIKMFKSTIPKSSSCKEIFCGVPLSIKGLSLSKRFFLLWLKWVCRKK